MFFGEDAEGEGAEGREGDFDGKDSVGGGCGCGLSGGGWRERFERVGGKDGG